MKIRPGDPTAFLSRREDPRRAGGAAWRGQHRRALSPWAALGVASRQARMSDCQSVPDVSLIGAGPVGMERSELRDGPRAGLSASTDGCLWSARSDPWGRPKKAPVRTTPDRRTSHPRPSLSRQSTTQKKAALTGLPHRDPNPITPRKRRLARRLQGGSPQGRWQCTTAASPQYEHSIVHTTLATAGRTPSRSRRIADAIPSVA